MLVFSLTGLPGEHTSYAYSARNGRLHHTAIGRATAQDFASSWCQGDTIGCGYDKRKRSIFFTLNGMLRWLHVMV